MIALFIRIGPLRLVAASFFKTGFGRQGYFVLLRDEGWIVPPNHGFRRENSAAAEWAVWVHVDDFARGQGGDISGGEQNVPASAVATGEFARVSFGLAGEGHLKLGNRLFAGDAGIQEQRGFSRDDDLAQPQLAEDAGRDHFHANPGIQV